MKRNDYTKPAMKVVELRQRAQLLTGSVGASRTGYETADSEEWN